MKKNHFLFALLLMFVFVGVTLAQNDEGAARMDALESQSILTEKVSNEKVHGIKPSEANVVSNVKPLEKTSKIEVTNAPISSNKIIKAERIKKNLKPENNNQTNAIGTLTLIGIILSAIGLIFVATIILCPIGVIFLVIGLVLLYSMERGFRLRDMKIPRN